jgi:hypothetical protein
MGVRVTSATAGPAPTVSGSARATTAPTRTYRPRARRAVAGVGALLWGFFFYGLIDLLVRFVPIDDFYDTYLLETGWGVLYFILVTVPLLSVVFVPALVSPVTQVALDGCAVAVAALFTHTWVQLLPAGVLVLIAAVLYLLGTPQTDTPPVPASGTRPGPARIDVPTLLLTGAAALPLMWFAAEMVRSAGAGLYPTTTSPRASTTGRCNPHCH